MYNKRSKKQSVMICRDMWRSIARELRRMSYENPCTWNKFEFNNGTKMRGYHLISDLKRYVCHRSYSDTLRQYNNCAACANADMGELSIAVDCNECFLLPLWQWDSRGSAQNACERADRSPYREIRYSYIGQIGDVGHIRMIISAERIADACKKLLKMMEDEYGNFEKIIERIMHKTVL